VDALVLAPSATPASVSRAGVPWLDLTTFEQYVWFTFVGAVAATVRCLPGFEALKARSITSRAR
jgi:hypothetical protein